MTDNEKRFIKSIFSGDSKGNLFYLLNFSYIGGCLALGTALFTAGKRYARHFLGVFEAATIH